MPRNLPKFRQFFWQSMGPALLVSIAAILILLIGGNTLFGPERTFVITARTLSADIKFSGTANAWSLSAARLCPALLRPTRQKASGVMQLCSASRFEPDIALTEPIVWQDGSEITVRVNPLGKLEILLRSDVGKMPKGSLIISGIEDWRKDGVLAFTGLAALGSELRSGNPDILLGGMYEVREIGLFSRLSVPRTHVVQTGLLNRGDQVSVVLAGDNSTPSLVYGHLAAPDQDQSIAMNTTTISATGDPALRVSYFGGQTPIIIRPDWIDSALANPTLIAAAFLVSFIASVLQLVLSLQVSSKSKA